MLLRILLQCCRMALCIFLVTATPWAAIIKAGDHLEIIVQSHPEFSGIYTVSPRGTIEHPLIADEPIAGILTANLMRDLTVRLAKYIDNPLVIVRIVENPEITVTVLGEVSKPGPHRTYRGATVQEAIVMAEPPKTADLTRIKIVRREGGEANADFFNLEEFLTSGRYDNLPRLSDGDKVIVLAKKASTKVKVLGAVNRPGFFEPEEEMNVLEIIYLAGGPAERADLSRVRRLSRNEGKTAEEVIDLQRFIDKGDVEGIPPVREGDIIIVYMKFFDWKTLLTVLNNTLLFIVTIQAFAGVFK